MLSTLPIELYFSLQISEHLELSQLDALELIVTTMTVTILLQYTG